MIEANGVAKWVWTGGEWIGSSLGQGVEWAITTSPEDVTYSPGVVSALALDGGVLYVGGRFNRTDRRVAHNLACWTGEEWLSLGSGANNIVEALLVTSDYLYAGGWFSSAGGMITPGIARWKW